MTVISLDDIQHCGGTQTRSNRKLLIVPCFLLSNLGLYLSISLLLVSLIMQTKHKCGDCQLNPTTAGLPAVVETVHIVTDVNVTISNQCGGLINTHPQHPRFGLVFHRVFCQNVFEKATYLHITNMESLVCTVNNSSKHKSTETKQWQQ